MIFIERASNIIIKRTLELSLATLLFSPIIVLGAIDTNQKTDLSDRIETIDAPREYLSKKFVDFVKDVDRYFGDERNYQESNDSVVQIDTTRIYGYHSNDRIELSGRAKIHLPSTQKRLHLVFESNPDQNASGDNPQSNNQVLNNKVSTPSSLGAALRYEKSKESQWHFSADTGIKLEGVKLDPYARTRVSYTVQKEPWQYKTSETLFWFNTIGPGETTQFDADRRISDSVLFRATSTGTWYDDILKLDLQQSGTIFHTISERTALLYQASISGFRQYGYQVTDTVLLITYRYRLHQKWVYFEFTPQIHFPKDKGYETSPALLMRLEALFDTKK